MPDLEIADLLESYELKQAELYFKNQRYDKALAMLLEL